MSAPDHAHLWNHTSLVFYVDLGYLEDRGDLIPPAL